MGLVTLIAFRTRRWFSPTVAISIFPILLTHTSEFPLVLGKYSLVYSIALVFYGINIVLLWWRAIFQVSYKSVIRGIYSRQLLPLFVTILSLTFLIDFVARQLPRAPSEWLVLVLLVGFIIQVEGFKRRPILASTNLALLSCSLALTVLLLELAFRFVLVEDRIPRSPNHFVSLMLGKSKTMGFSSVNPTWLGPISLKKPAGTFRILGLSDSFGTAGGRDNYHYLLETVLHGELRERIQVVNASMPGYEPRHELLILRFGMAYSPDLVLHGFFVGNDFSLRNDEMYALSGIPVNRRENTSAYRPKDFLLREWFANLVGFYFEKRRRRGELDSGVVKEVGSFSKHKFLEIQFGRMNEWGKRTETNIKRMESIFPVLDAIRVAIHAKGVKYVMVIHPDQTQVDNGLRRELMTSYQLDESEYDFDLPQKILKSYCQDRRIVCLDLLPKFRQGAEQAELYLRRDTHYNEKGNRLAASAIGAFLMERSLLGKTVKTESQEVGGRP